LVIKYFIKKEVKIYIFILNQAKYKLNIHGQAFKKKKKKKKKKAKMNIFMAYMY